MRREGQAALDGVSVHVAQLLCQLAIGEDVEVVVAGQPKGTTRALYRDRQLEGLDRFGEGDLFWFGEENVDVLGHDYVAENVEGIALAHGFESLLEEFTRGLRAEVGTTLVTTEGDEVQMPALLIPHQTL